MRRSLDLAPRLGRARVDVRPGRPPRTAGTSTRRSVVSYENELSVSERRTEVTGSSDPSLG